jgi:hypothetical protein
VNFFANLRTMLWILSLLLLLSQLVRYSVDVALDDER